MTKQQMEINFASVGNSDLKKFIAHRKFPNLKLIKIKSTASEIWDEVKVKEDAQSLLICQQFLKNNPDNTTEIGDLFCSPYHPVVVNFSKLPSWQSNFIVDLTVENCNTTFISRWVTNCKQLKRLSYEPNEQLNWSALNF
jgi:hypothetical protein